MTYILGIGGGTLIGSGDAAAAIFRGGELIAAAEEERFVGIKHANGHLPEQAIRYCLREASISIRDVALVGSHGITYPNYRETLSDWFQFTFGFAPPIELVDHHTAHIASSYFLSPFYPGPALGISFDFSGDGTSTLIARCERNGMSELCRIRKPNSLGAFYAMMTQYLGFEKDEDEYKVMGLAAYGEPTVDLSWLLQPDGDAYRLNENYLKASLQPHRPGPSRQERLFIDLPLPQRSRLRDEPVTEYYRNVAASVQKALEDTVVHMVRVWAARTGLSRLCLAGGVALNCRMNQAIRCSDAIDQIFVPPHCSDAGQAVGAAVLLAMDLGERPTAMRHAYLGPEYTASQLRGVLDECGAAYGEPGDIEAEVADDLVAGRIVGWFQGRMEFGPRALGSRSILADPRRAEMKDVINHRVKFREPFRPFTPSVLAEAVPHYFERPMHSPFMTITFSALPGREYEMPAVVHADGTVRIQSVTREDNQPYHRLLTAFAERTGVPVLLNTSMNVKGQPICRGPREALSTYFATGMDCLALGPFYLRKNGRSDTDRLVGSTPRPLTVPV